jgi:quinol monooxygenase YgiN
MSQRTYSPIVELRMYTLHPGRRDELIKLFEREFIETQEAVGMHVIGQFYDLDDPNRFIWLRGFNDMSARAASLQAFYGGPIWKAHRDAANATMIDSDNVLLLRLPHRNCGFSLKDSNRPPQGSRAKQDGFVSATIYYFDAPVNSEFTSAFESMIKPILIESGASILAYFLTEDSPNTFPALPIREGENVFVWFGGFPDQDAYKSHLAKLRESKLWNDEIPTFLKKHLQGQPEVLRLTPTPRSWLTGKV